MLSHSIWTHKPNIRIMRNDNIEALCKRNFLNHKATLIQNTDRFFIVDWRSEDGSGDYYVNYIVDKQRGSLIISGDLGDCIATWYNHLEPEKIKNFIYRDAGYFVSKFQASSDKYVYDEDEIYNEIRTMFEEDCTDIDEYIKENNYESSNDFYKDLREEISESVNNNNFTPTPTLITMLGDLGYNPYEWIYDCGRSISPRVYLWAEGFYRACEQLGI